MLLMDRRIAVFRLVAVVALASLGAAAGPVAAQSFPNKALRVVNPNGPGGNSDAVFRLLTPKMTEVLGQQMRHLGAGSRIW